MQERELSGDPIQMEHCVEQRAPIHDLPSLGEGRESQVRCTKSQTMRSEKGGNPNPTPNSTCAGPFPVQKSSLELAEARYVARVSS